MPPRTRATKSTKDLKENIGVVQKTNKRVIGKAAKPARKALTDKTNSASDDNTSSECIKEVVKKPPTIKLVQSKLIIEDQDRPRRDRRLPNRFVDNQVLNNLSNNKENTPSSSVFKESPESSVNPESVDVSAASPFKTPQKPAETSLVTFRPRRVSRLPSRFEDHSISPSKFIPVQPAHASTPILQSKTAIPNKNNGAFKNKSTKIEQSKASSNKKVEEKKNINKSKDKVSQKVSEKDKEKVTQKESPVKRSKLPITQSKKKTAPDSNNNATGRTLRARKLPDTESTENKKQALKNSESINASIAPSPKKQKPSKNNFSYKVLEDKKTNDNGSKEDVYEFTFDPAEEPPPPKKKKKVVKKKPSKPKTVVFKNNYDQNVNKALALLKNVVSKKPVQNDAAKTSKPVQSTTVKASVNLPEAKAVKKPENTIPQIQRNVASKIIISGSQPAKQNVTQTKQKGKALPTVTSNKVATTVPDNNKSIPIEDIAADFVSPIHDINYSPVNSPAHPTTPAYQPNETPSRHNDDPLKLRDHISFFDDNPVASSSMNSSVRHPEASPWRVEFGNLPIRWHTNSYVKANMTPAVECSFVNFEDKNKKKHVYTNMVPESNVTLPDIVVNEQPNMIQTSIISFIREAVEKSSSKKKRDNSVTPAPLSSHSNNKTPNKDHENATNTNTGKASRQLFTPHKTQAASDVPNIRDTSSDKENCQESLTGQKHKHNEDPNTIPAKTPRKDKDNTYFGFDVSENLDQENISPKKNIGRKRTLRPRTRAVLKELNEPSGPTRAVVPLAAKTVRNAEIEKLYEEIKSATDAPVFPDKEAENVVATNVEALDEMLNEEDTNSVHLFEDIVVVHHTKPQRKSYGKPKVKFRQLPTDSTAQEIGKPRADSDYEDNLDDLTFDPGVPFLEEKKARKKQSKRQKMTKKEEEEADVWAANFNSMCEDVEEFTLLVE